MRRTNRTGFCDCIGTVLADSGAAVNEIMAILGHTTEKQATHDTKTANRRRLALRGLERLSDPSNG